MQHLLRKRASTKRANVTPVLQRLLHLLVALSLFHSQALQAHAFSRPTYSRISFLLQATVDPFAEGAPDLYKVLGASPKDSDIILKKKWQQLARKLHPDANVKIPNTNISTVSGEDSAALAQQEEKAFSEQYPYDISDVNAAWGVLSNPKERRKYDRELQAKEMADNFEALMDAGIKSAIPFLKKTAKSTASAVESSAKTWTDVSQKSSQVMSDVNKRVTTAAAIFDLDSESRELELKASRAMSQAKQIETQIKTQDDRRIDILQEPKSRLTSVDATRFLQKFNLTTQEQPATANEIAALEKLEIEYKDKSQVHDQMERNLGVAAKQAADAIRAEERAAERLLQAQKELKAAQDKNTESQKARLEAIQAEKDALVRADKSSAKLNEQTEHVRKYLKRNEDISMKREILSLQMKKQEIVETAEEVKKQAQEIKRKADELRLKAKEEEKEARNR